MIPVTQDKFGAEEGNCLMAALASIFDVPLSTAPDYSPKGDWWGATQKFCNAHRTWAMYMPKGVLPAPPRGYHVICGQSERGLLHAVVGLNGQIVHDPHPSRAGLLDVEGYIALLPLADADRT